MAADPEVWVVQSRRLKLHNWKEEDLFVDDAESDASDWDQLDEAAKDTRRKTATIIADLPKEFNSFVVGSVVKEQVSERMLHSANSNYSRPLYCAHFSNNN